MITGQSIKSESSEQHMTRARIKILRAEIATLCRRHHIRKLALSGSVLRDDFRHGSDIDVLVEFEPGHIPGLIRLAGMELELSDLLGGHRVDMNTPMCLSPYFRGEVQATAERVYGKSFTKIAECPSSEEFDKK